MAPPEAFEENMLPKGMLNCDQRSITMDHMATPELCMQYRFSIQLEDVNSDSMDRNLPNDVDDSQFRQYLVCPAAGHLSLLLQSLRLEPGCDTVPFDVSMRKVRFHGIEQEGLHSPIPKIPDQNGGDISASCSGVVGGDGEECSVTAESPESNPDINDTNNATSSNPDVDDTNNATSSNPDVDDTNNATSTFPTSVDQHHTTEGCKNANNIELKSEQPRAEETALLDAMERITNFYTKFLTLKLQGSVCEEENNVELPSGRAKDHSWENLDSRVDEPMQMTKISHKSSGSKLKSLPLKERTGYLPSLPMMPPENPKGAQCRDKEATTDTVFSKEGDGPAKPVYSAFQEASPGSAQDSSPYSSPCLTSGPAQDHSQVPIDAELLNKTQLGGEIKQLCKESPKYEKVDDRERKEPARKKHCPTWTDDGPVDADSSSSQKHSRSQSDGGGGDRSSKQNNGRKGGSGFKRGRDRVQSTGGGSGDDEEEDTPPNDRKTKHSRSITTEEEMKKKPASGVHGAFGITFPRHPPVPPETEHRETDDQLKPLYNFKPPPMSSSDLESTSMSSFIGESDNSSSIAVATANKFENEPLRRVRDRNDTGYHSTPTGLLGVVALTDNAVEPPPANVGQHQHDQPPDADVTPDCPVLNEHPLPHVRQQRDNHLPGDGSGDGRVSPPPRHDLEVADDPPCLPPVAEPNDRVLDSFEYLDNSTFQENKPSMVFSPAIFTSQCSERSPSHQVRPNIVATGHSGEARCHGFCQCPVKECEDTMPDRSELVVNSNLSPPQMPRVVPQVAQEDELLQDEDPLVLLRPYSIDVHTTIEQYDVWSFSALVDVFVQHITEANDCLNDTNND